MPINIRRRIRAEIFDYQTLIDALKGLAYPRNRINDLLRQGIIIRVKKGLYVFGEEERRRPYSKELLANLIYGPSYVSLDYALAYYGFIPERVEALTSVTPNRSRGFITPVGLFNYRQIPLQAYDAGVVRIETGPDQAFLMASPEKALADKVVAARGARNASVAEMGRFLEEDLRIDRRALQSLTVRMINEFAARYRSAKLRTLAALMRRLARSAQEARHE